MKKKDAELEAFLKDLMDLRGWTRKEALHAANGCPRFYWSMFYSLLEDHPGIDEWESLDVDNWPCC